MFIIRPVLVPLAQRYNCGPALFVFEMWYLSVGFLMGIARLMMLFVLILDSYFQVRPLHPSPRSSPNPEPQP